MQYICVLCFCEHFGTCEQVGFAGEGEPRHIIRRMRKAEDASLTYEDQIELMLRDIFAHNLMCQARHRHVLVCESLVESTRHRRAVVKVLLQRLGAASVLLLPAPQMALYASGLDRDVSGLVVQVGYSETTVLPVCWRLPLVQSASIAKLGSRTLHQCLITLALEGKDVIWMKKPRAPQKS